MCRWCDLSYYVFSETFRLVMNVIALYMQQMNFFVSIFVVCTFCKDVLLNNCASYIFQLIQDIKCFVPHSFLLAVKLNLFISLLTTCGLRKRLIWQQQNVYTAVKIFQHSIINLEKLWFKFYEMSQLSQSQLLLTLVVNNKDRNN